MRGLRLLGRSRHIQVCRRGSKNYDWYFKQLKVDEQKKQEQSHNQKVPKLPCPTEGVRRPKVYMDFAKGGEKIGRVTFELAQDLLPKTATNFLNLCTEAGESKLTYKGTVIHRIAQGEYLLGGDVLMEEGCGTFSSFGTKFFEDESFLIKHRTGVISMANSGTNTNGSQFFVTLKDCSHLNGRNVAFGAVSEGMDILLQLGRTLCFSGKPVIPIVVSDCGIVN